jgi:DNA sulfur modification protein DndB
MKTVKIFDKLTDTERSSLPPRSSKLFTLSGIYTATNLLLANYKDVDFDKQAGLASQYWNAVAAQMSDWQDVLNKKVSAGELRRDYVHSHAVTLVGLGGAGAALLSLYPNNWAKRLKPLQSINWERSNPAWEGSVIVGGSVHNNRTSRSFMIGYLKKALGLPLSPEEEKLLGSIQR